METETPVINMSLSNKKKGEISSDDFKCAFDVIRSSLNNYEAVYTGKRSGSAYPTSHQYLPLN